MTRAGDTWRILTIPPMRGEDSPTLTVGQATFPDRDATLAGIRQALKLLQGVESTARIAPNNGYRAHIDDQLWEFWAVLVSRTEEEAVDERLEARDGVPGRLTEAFQQGVVDAQEAREHLGLDRD